MNDGIWLKIKNNDWRPRKDIKHPHWFKCSNRLLEDEDFYDFSFDEIAVWIHILSLASLKDSDTVFLNFISAERKSRLKEKTIVSAIEKLNGKQIEMLPDHDPYATRTERVRNVVPREERRRIEEIQNEDQLRWYTNIRDRYVALFKNVRAGVKAQERFAEQIKTEERADQLLKAIEHYKIALDYDNRIKEWRSPKTTFETFLGTKKSGFFWEQFIEAPNTPTKTRLVL